MSIFLIFFFTMNRLETLPDSYLFISECVDVSDKLIAIAATNILIYIFSTEQNAKFGSLMRVLLGHLRTITCLAFSPDSSRLVSGSHDRSVIIWNTTTFIETHKFRENYSKSVLGLAWLPDNDRFVSVSDDNHLTMWSAKKSTVLFVFDSHAMKMDNVAVSADGHHIATCSSQITSEPTIELWQPHHPKHRACLTGQIHSIFSLAFCPTNNDILLSGGFRIILIHNIRNNSIINTLAEDGCHLCWSRNGLFFLSCHYITNTNITLWDFTRGNRVKCYGKQRRAVCSASVATNEPYFATVSRDGDCQIISLPWYTYPRPESICAQDINRLTLLQQALLQPRDDILTFEALLQCPGVDLDARDLDGNTALHVAMFLENEEATNILLQKGARKDIVNKWGRIPATPTHIYTLLPPALWTMAFNYMTKLKT